jgi:hypothetical protein
MTGQIFGSGIASVRLLSSAAGASLKPEEQLEAFRPDKHTHLRLRFDDDGPRSSSETRASSARCS